MKPSSVSWAVPEDEVRFRFVASGGPGGQHANRSNTKVEAVLRIEEATMPEDLRERVIERFGNVIRVTVDAERSQLRNRQIALERIQQRIDSASRVKRKRTATKPTRGSQKRRIDAKRRRSDTKRFRRTPRLDD